MAQKLVNHGANAFLMMSENTFSLSHSLILLFLWNNQLETHQVNAITKERGGFPGTNSRNKMEPELYLGTTSFTKVDKLIPGDDVINKFSNSITMLG